MRGQHLSRNKRKIFFRKKIRKFVRVNLFVFQAWGWNVRHIPTAVDTAIVLRIWAWEFVLSQKTDVNIMEIYVDSNRNRELLQQNLNHLSRPLVTR